MAKKEKQLTSIRKMRRIKALLIAGYAVIVAGAILLVSVLAIRKTDTVLKSKVSSLTSSLNVQMKLNMESYIARMESIATLAFADEDCYTYDATDPENDEFEALATERSISEELYSLCIMENFVDYAIVYRDNHPVGKMSNGTVALFGDRLFEDLHAMISQERTRDGWSAGYNGDFRRVYYVKEMHENALLVISFYTSELESVFDNPETLSDMSIRLTDGDYNIIYSSDESDELGAALPKDILDRVSGRDDATMMDDSYLVTINRCCDDWNVICSIPTRIILNEKNEMRVYIFLTAAVAGLFAILLGMLLSIKLSDVATEMVTSLDVKAHMDQLTGLLNKRSFEEETQNRLSDTSQEQRHALILLDVDNFKGVNDTLGHAYGDKVLSRVGTTLMTVFSSEDYLGRVGGDEFCVLMNFAPQAGDARELARAKCEALCGAFRDYYTGSDGGYKVSVSIGVALCPEHGTTFKELYTAADTALYRSKRGGKDTYTFYDPSMGGES